MSKTSTGRPINIEFTGTPEAGKTTQFKIISSTLQEEGYKVVTVGESAEVVPACFGKASPDWHRWMGLHTIMNLLCANAEDADIIIVDRGYVDHLIWQEVYCGEGKISDREKTASYEYFRQFIPMPDMVFVFSVPPDVSIERRGGEGRITNRSFISRYNPLLDSFFESYEGCVCRVDATLTIPEVSQLLMDNIHSILGQ